jgi:hypothetical protein
MNKNKNNKLCGLSLRANYTNRLPLVSAMYPYSRIIDFLDWSHYFAENLVAPGIKPRTSEFVARNSDR